MNYWQAKRPLQESTKGQSSTGFTLIEVLVVLLISTILTLISVALYQRSVRRSILQGEAIALATRLEQAKTLAISQSRQYRITFNENSGAYIPETYDNGLKDWVIAESISSRSLDLNPRISYGFPVTANIPTYGPSITGIASATPVSSAIQFNSRGFPVLIGDPLPPLAIRPDNVVYLTNQKDYFAVTVDILGRVRVWAWDSPSQIWVLISL